MPGGGSWVGWFGWSSLRCGVLDVGRCWGRGQRGVVDSSGRALETHVPWSGPWWPPHATNRRPCLPCQHPHMLPRALCGCRCTLYCIPVFLRTQLPLPFKSTPLAPPQPTRSHSGFETRPARPPCRPAPPTRPHPALPPAQLKQQLRSPPHTHKHRRWPASRGTWDQSVVLLAASGWDPPAPRKRARGPRLAPPAAVVVVVVVVVQGSEVWVILVELRQSV